MTEWCLSWPAFLGKPRATRESHEEGVRLHAFPESLTLANNLVSGPRFTLVPLRVVARCGSDVGVAFGMGSGKWWLLEKNGDWSCSHSTFGQHFASPYESLLWTCCREDICNSFLPFFFFFFKVDHLLSLYWIFYNVVSILWFFFFLAVRHVGSSLTKQRLNPHTLHWKVKS